MKAYSDFNCDLCHIYATANCSGPQSNYNVSCQFAVAFSDQSDGHSNLLRPWPRSKVRFNVNTWPPVH